MPTDLTPYGGAFGRAEAWHLLRRATFAVPAARVEEAVALGLAGTLDRLLTPDVSIGPPLNDAESDDPNVPLGQTWIRAPLVIGRSLNTYRLNSLTAWLYEQFARAGFSLERRMFLFWINHFGASRNGDPRSVYTYYETLRTGVFGSFPDLVKQIGRESMMLIFLDGRSNTAGSPNENYARELLELFTIGKGAAAGPGDYTTYTEDDVRALARALTGWKTRYHGSINPEQQPESYFRASHHDTDPKVLSPRLGGAVITDQGEAEMDAVVDVIFAQATAGDYLCRKLYRWFVHYEITPAVEDAIIQPMAAALRASGYRVDAPLRLLLGSAHFFEVGLRGALVRSPLDATLSVTSEIPVTIPAALEVRYQAYRRFHGQVALQDMTLYDPGSVAGYKPYHQAPHYNRLWLNGATLQSRTSFTRQLLTRGFAAGDTRLRPDLLGFIADFADATDPNALVAEAAERLLPTPLSQPQLDGLKEVLIPGLPDFEWTVEYSDHLANPADEDMRKAVENKLVELFGALTGAAEYHLY